MINHIDLGIFLVLILVLICPTRKMKFRDLSINSYNLLDSKSTDFIYGISTSRSICISKKLQKN
jgi:hypothetical protein